MTHHSLHLHSSLPPTPITTPSCTPHYSLLFPSPLPLIPLTTLSCPHHHSLLSSSPLPLVLLITPSYPPHHSLLSPSPLPLIPINTSACPPHHSLFPRQHSLLFPSARFSLVALSKTSTFCEGSSMSRVRFMVVITWLQSHGMHSCSEKMG